MREATQSLEESAERRTRGSVGAAAAGSNDDDDDGDSVAEVEPDELFSA
jgi:hypothetical protein